MATGYVNEKLGINDPNLKTISSASGDVRPVTEMAGDTVKMTKNGITKEVDRNLSPSFERAGYTLASTNPEDNIVSGSSDIRNDITDVKNEASDIIKNIETKETIDSGIADINNMYSSLDLTENQEEIDRLQQELDDMVNNGLVTTAQQAVIDAAGEKAGADYEDAILEAEESARIGKPKALSAAGARGGFMNTQFAGSSAVQGSDTFAGVGGELERINSAYDRTVANLKTKQAAAITAAKEAAREAMISGKRTDLSYAQEAVKTALQAKELEISIADRKAAAIANYKTQQETEYTNNLTKATESIIGALTGDATADANIIKQYATKYGLDENQLKNYVKQYQAEQQTTLLDNATKSFNIAKNLAVGQTYTLDDGTVITGVAQTDDGYETTFQTANGQNMMITYDKAGNIIKQQSLGSAYKGTGSGSGSGTGASDSDIKDFRDVLSNYVGGDGFVSPDRYQEGRVLWIEQGKDPAEYDKEFAGFRNPNNPYYDVEKYDKDILESELESELTKD